MKNLLKHPTIINFIGKMPTVKQLFFTTLGTLLLAFLFLSLLSHNVNDPAWSHISNNTDTTNIMGRLGAWISDILQVFFGLGAWWVTIALCFELMRLWWKHEALAWQLRAIAHVFLLIFISGLLASFNIATNGAPTLWLGGVVGHELYGGLVSLFGSKLATLFLCVLITIVISLTLNIPYKKLFGKFKSTKENVVATQDNEQKLDTQDKKSTLFSIFKSEENKKDTPLAPSESLGEFLQKSGLKEKVLSRHLSSLQEEAQKNQSDTSQDDTNLVQQPSDNNKVHAVSVTMPTKPSTDKSYIDSHGMGVTTVHTNVKIQHTNSFDENTKCPSVNTDKNTSRKAEPFTPNDDNPLSVQPHLSNQGVTPHALTHHISTPKSEQHHHNQTDKICDTTDDVGDTLTATMTDTQSDDQPTKNPKSHAMSTLEYRMSLSPVPELNLLDPAPPKKTTYTPEELERLSELLEIKLQEFNINAKVVSAIVGPVVTRFEVELAAGIKVSRVTKVAQDLARSMSMASLRVLPVIVGKPYIGIEVPNRHREIVGLIELLQTDDYQDPNAGISIAIGQDISGRAVIADLAKAPHMLVAGTTGSGKSVLVNSFLLSMLLKYTPDELKLVLIDPKQLELANYSDIPHLLTPVITDMTEATAVLNWCVNEMERRYALIGSLKVRQLTEFNKKVLHAQEVGEPLTDPLWQASEHVGDKPPKLKPLPKIVVVADEFADMIMQLGKTAEEPIVRLAQKARAAGIHLILATQRPVASVVTGLIKSNVPSRVALRVNSAMDSRLIIEESGAENMLGHGDMMFLAPGKNTTERVHGAYVKDDEVNRVTDAWRERGSPDYIDLSNSYLLDGEGSGNISASSGGDEDYYNQAVTFFIESKKVSISSLQRKLSIGYNKAARLVDLMEERGVVSAPDTSGKRQLLI